MTRIPIDTEDISSLLSWRFKRDFFQILTIQMADMNHCIICGCDNPVDPRDLPMIGAPGPFVGDHPFDNPWESGAVNGWRIIMSCQVCGYVVDEVHDVHFLGVPGPDVQIYAALRRGLRVLIPGVDVLGEWEDRAPVPPAPNQRSADQTPSEFVSRGKSPDLT
jgi:hypothetical protein